MAEAVIWTPRMLEALANGVKGGKWFSLIDKVYQPQTLEIAWKKVRRNRGAAGIDRVSVAAFDKDAEKHLARLAEELRTGTYRAQPVRRVEIDKDGGKKRPLGIPAVRDRIVQTAVKMALEPIYEMQFAISSYGFRPGKSAHDALLAVRTFLKLGYVCVVDADLKGYFDSIPHDRMMNRIRESISDGRLLALLEQWLKQDIVSELARWSPTQGTPQGAVISPLLANLYLHSMDTHLASKGYVLIRYADDFVIMCRTESEAKEALKEVANWATENGLELHPEKTRIANGRDKGAGFDFLGYHFEGRSRDVRKKSVDKVKDKIRMHTPRRTSGISLDNTIRKLNPILKGWFNYFRDGKRLTFVIIDQLIRRRLRAMLLNRKKKRGHGRTLRDHRTWQISFFEENGLFSLAKAHKLYRQPL
jgi:RNA-directed DNA polymerase